jgi:GntR family transcriptional regulator, colanic acid and biofilm gene transcriptional regulator
MPDDALRIDPVEQGNLSARTYIALKDALIGGKFRPGQRLLMQELAIQLGTSVTPVREACMRLVAERGLEVRSGRFVTVPDLTVARYMEIRTIRMELEGLAAELAAKHVTAADVRAMSELQAQFETADEAHDAQVAIRINRDFHFKVYGLSRMPMLISHIESLWISMGPILNVFYNEVENDYVGAEAHRHLLKALRARDGRKARDAIVMDIARGGQALLSYLNGESARPPSRRRRR